MAGQQMASGPTDHPFTLVVGTVVVVLSFVVFSMPWYYALIAGMLVSGLTEFAIREVPADTEDYDPEQYRLWAAADENKTVTSAEAESEAAIEQLRERYAQGELSDEEFERKVEELLATDATEDAEREVLTEDH
jgi:hypothetical protein